MLPLGPASHHIWPEEGIPEGQANKTTRIIKGLKKMDGPHPQPELAELFMFRRPSRTMIDWPGGTR